MLNKVDIADPAVVTRIRGRERRTIVVSAHTGQGIDDLLQLISDELPRPDVSIDLVVPYHRGDLVNRVHLTGRSTSRSTSSRGPGCSLVSTRGSRSSSTRRPSPRESWRRGPGCCRARAVRVRPAGRLGAPVVSVSPRRLPGARGEHHHPDHGPRDPDVEELLDLAVAALGGGRRAGQHQMAVNVATAIDGSSGPDHLLVQAGTGTGSRSATSCPRYATRCARTSG
ncbi:hypothetical protein NKG05_00520 [Oerskovia sp. M15]